MYVVLKIMIIELLYNALAAIFKKKPSNHLISATVSPILIFDAFWHCGAHCPLQGTDR